MHIDIDKGGIAFEEQRPSGVAVTGEEIGIGAAHRPHQQFVAHRAAVDEQKLHLRVGAIVGGKPGITGHAQGFARDVDGLCILGKFAAHDGR